MTPVTTSITRIVYLAVVMLWSSAPAFAQPIPYNHLVTVSPFGWPDGHVDVEWQTCGSDGDGRRSCELRVGLRAASGRGTLGDGAEGPATSDRFFVLDAIIRLNDPLENRHAAGWAFGLSAGLVRFTDGAAGPALGLELGQTWLFRQRLIVGAGAGVKGVVLLRDGLTFAAIPAVRLSVGVAF